MFQNGVKIIRKRLRVIPLLFRGLSGWGFLAGVFISVLVFFAAENALMKDHRYRFDSVARELHQTLSNRLENTSLVLRGAQALAHSQQNLKRHEFAAYVAQMDFEQLGIGVRRLGLVERVSTSFIERHTRTVRADGWKNYRIWPEPSRADAYPIVYLQPNEAEVVASLGFDMSTRPGRWAAMETARDSGQVAFSPVIDLLPANGGGEVSQLGILAFVPLYRGREIPSQVERRRDELSGFIYAPVRVRKFMQEVLTDQDFDRLKVDLEIIAKDDQGRDRLLFNSRAAGADELSAKFLQKRTLFLPAQSWSIVVRSRDEFIPIFLQAVPFLIALGSIVAVIFLTWWTFEREEVRRTLERLVQERTAELRTLLGAQKRTNATLRSVNDELEAFCYSVSHDLRSPLRAIDGFSQALVEDCGSRLDEQNHGHLKRIRDAAGEMSHLIDDLLRLSRIARAELSWMSLDLTEIAEQKIEDLRKASPDRRVEAQIQSELRAYGDPTLLRIVIENLIDNAWKFTSKQEFTRIQVGSLEKDGETLYFVEDNGVGFNMEYADRLFGAFQRLHRTNEFPGRGVGLATVRRAVQRHLGRIWATARSGEGAKFFFTLGEGPAPESKSPG